MMLTESYFTEVFLHQTEGFSLYLPLNSNWQTSVLVPFPAFVYDL